MDVILVVVVGMKVVGVAVVSEEVVLDSPVAGTPAAGTPVAGTPEVGTTEAGTPVVGTPEVGTPEVDKMEVQGMLGVVVCKRIVLFEVCAEFCFSCCFHFQRDTLRNGDNFPQHQVNILLQGVTQRYTFEYATGP